MGLVKSVVNRVAFEMTELNYKDPVGKKLVFGFAGAMTVVALAAIAAGVLHRYNQFPMPSNPMIEKMLVGGGVGVLSVEAALGGFFKWSQSKVREKVEAIKEEFENETTSFVVSSDLVIPIKKAFEEEGKVDSRILGIGECTEGAIRLFSGQMECVNINARRVV